MLLVLLCFCLSICLDICLGTEDVPTHRCGTLGDDCAQLAICIFMKKKFLSNLNEFTIFKSLVNTWSCSLALSSTVAFPLMEYSVRVESGNNAIAVHSRDCGNMTSLQAAAVRAHSADQAYVIVRCRASSFHHHLCLAKIFLSPPSGMEELIPSSIII